MNITIIARSISLALHPLTIPFYGMALLFSTPLYASIPLRIKIYCYLIALTTLVVMPLLALPIMIRLNWIQSYRMDTSRERLCPAILSIICAFIGLWLTSQIAFTHYLAQIYLIVIIALSVFSLVTYFWKISMHMMTIGIFCGVIICWQRWASYMMIDFRPNFIVAILCAGLLGTARLYLGKHDFLQILIGFLFGLVLTLLLPIS